MFSSSNLQHDDCSVRVMAGEQERALRRAARLKAEQDSFESIQELDGSVTFPDGSFYSGKYRACRKESDWENGMTKLIHRHGQGTFTFSDGSVYEGQWEHDVMKGSGVAKYANGVVMEGYWENGLLATGQMTCKESEYIGPFQDGKFHGYGRLNNTDGSSYVGEWACGHRSGILSVSL